MGKVVGEGNTNKVPPGWGELCGWQRRLAQNAHGMSRLIQVAVPGEIANMVGRGAASRPGCIPMPGP